MLHVTKHITGVVTLLVLLCFFFSMFITNDVALITFVPFTITIMHRLGRKVSYKWMINVIVMQTIAANLGSMFTPIGNPQNLYLFGKTELSVPTFLKLMFPYTMSALVLLFVWIFIITRKENIKIVPIEVQSATVNETLVLHYWERMTAYGILFVISLLSVARIVPYPIVFVLVMAYVICRDCSLLKEVDYSLLGTFAGLFIFIGNLGRLPVFHDFLQQIIGGREMLTAILASQIMSNVPAAILLSGFTDNKQALMIGTNLGGLGTMIASMASLISFKYVCRENPLLKRIYFRVFTLSNIVFLLILGGLAVACGGHS